MSEPHTEAHESASCPDKCPGWAEQLIARIRALEIQLGNIRPDEDGWQSLTAQELAQRAMAVNVEDNVGEIDASLTETLFERVCRGLNEEGYDSAAIAAMFNARIRSGRLPYCSAEEVEDTLSDGNLE